MQKLEKDVINYIWCGRVETRRSRIALALLAQSKAKGGPGVLNVQKQVDALAACLIQWTILASTNTKCSHQHLSELEPSVKVTTTKALAFDTGLATHSHIGREGVFNTPAPLQSL
ncbi:hypothetical protein Mapa_012173 [Marchantia paleacea]|nr:hypothetical protein Mapa_012173 [Marchantia paleacea]